MTQHSYAMDKNGEYVLVEVVGVPQWGILKQISEKILLHNHLCKPGIHKHKKRLLQITLWRASKYDL